MEHLTVLERERLIVARGDIPEMRRLVLVLAEYQLHLLLSRLPLAQRTLMEIVIEELMRRKREQRT